VSVCSRDEGVVLNTPILLRCKQMRHGLFYTTTIPYLLPS